MLRQKIVHWALSAADTSGHAYPSEKIIRHAAITLDDLKSVRIMEDHFNVVRDAETAVSGWLVDGSSLLSLLCLSVSGWPSFSLRAISRVESLFTHLMAESFSMISRRPTRSTAVQIIPKIKGARKPNVWNRIPETGGPISDLTYVYEQVWKNPTQSSIENLTRVKDRSSQNPSALFPSIVSEQCK